MQHGEIEYVFRSWHKPKIGVEPRRDIKSKKRRVHEGRQCHGEPQFIILPAGTSKKAAMISWTSVGSPQPARSADDQGVLASLPREPREG